MSSGTATQDECRSVREICQEIKLGDQARELLKDGLKPQAYLDLLVQARLEEDAVRFMAHWLPKREAVWWGCLCVWSVCRPKPSEAVDAALNAAVRWVREPSEETRRAAELHGKVAGPKTPAGGVALAAFHHSGSISRPGLPEVPAPPGLTARMTANAVGLAACQGDPSTAADRRRQFLRLGLEVALKKNHWE